MRKTVSYRDVTLKSGFLYEKQLLNRNAAMDAVYDRFSGTGRSWCVSIRLEAGHAESAAFLLGFGCRQVDGGRGLHTCRRSAIRSLKRKWKASLTISRRIRKTADISTSTSPYASRTSVSRTGHWHELYCAGHLFEAAVAYYEATGKDRFLLLMEKYADFIKKIFVDEKSAAFSTPGHEEIELALIRMYRATGKKKFLDLAAFFINGRSVLDSDGTPYNQSHLPVREQSGAVGHCVSLLFCIPQWRISHMKQTTRSCIIPARRFSTILSAEKCM